MSIGALIEKFRAVALDRIERMNLDMLALERAPGDAEAAEELLREIHTLKGEAKMMGFADVNLVAHQTENLLIAAHERGWEMPRQLVDQVFEGFDLVRALLTKSTGSNDDPIDLSDFVEGVQRSLEALEAPPPEAEGDPPEASTAHAPEPPARDEDEPAPAGDAPAPEEKTDEEDEPALEPGRPPRPTGFEREAARSTRTRLASATTTEGPGLERGERGRRQTTPTGMLRIQAENSLRVRFDKLERLGDAASEVLLMGRRLEYELGELEELRGQLRAWMGTVEPNLPKSRMAALRDLSHRLDAIVSTASEDNHLVNLRAVQLDEEVRSLRHVSLAQVISHYPRAVRDLAQSQGKQVRFAHDLGNLEVDRAVLSALSDPLLHLVRNAVDHGVEPPEARRAQGKPEEATVRLEVEPVGDSLRVILRDDGQGIDPEHVRQRALSKGVIDADQAQVMSDQQALALIFEPGFSTREAISDVSGRGIGMDIVLRQITNLGGVVEVESEPGQGTTFTLLVPMSSAVIEVLLVEIGGETFGIHAKDIDRVEMVSPHQLLTIQGSACVRLDGQLVPLLDWRPTLIGEPGELPARGRLPLLLVRKGTRTTAAWVDAVLGEREALNRPLGEFLQGVRLCRGVVLTEAGEVLPLLNIVELLTRSHGQLELPPQLGDLRRTWSTLELQSLPRMRSILVAEDSEVTRELVAGILRGLGYRVLEAQDGQQAWEMLQDHRVDLMLTDIQMPRLDGLGLLDRVRRAGGELAEVPIIVLSTLGSAADREQAMQLGADAYLVKLDFREKDLVGLVRRYLKR